MSDYKKSRCGVFRCGVVAVGCGLGTGRSSGILSPPANVRPPGLQNVGIEQKLNGQIPLDLTFHDETGKTVKLGDYFGKKPVILNLVYFRCPMLCGEVLSGLTSAMKDFEVRCRQGVQRAHRELRSARDAGAGGAKKAEYIKRYGRAGAAEGWHFLTGDQESIRR